MNYEALLNKKNVNPIQNAIKICQREKDKIDMKYRPNEQDEDSKEEVQDGAYKLKRK